MPILNMVWWWKKRGNIWEPLNLTVTTSWLDATITWEDNEIWTIPPTTFQKSELVRKVGSAPTSPSDWDLVVTETVKDTYKTTWYVDQWLTDWETYYYRVFSYSDLGGISYCDAVSNSWQPDASRTIFYYEFENNLDDSSGNWHNITSSTWVWYSTVWWQQVLIATNNDSWLDVSPSRTSGIWSWDFAISFWLYPVQPSWDRYPMLVGISYNNSPYTWPTIFYDPLNFNGNGDCIYFRMRWWGQAYEHASTTTASSLYNSWHHIVMTRISWTVSCYIDWTLETSWSGDTESFPTYNYAGHIFARSDYSYQARGATGAMTDKFILENVWWTAQEIASYYNQTKSLYWIS